MSRCTPVNKLVVAIALTAAALSLCSCAVPVAPPVPGLPGYVFSPYTCSPRYVDVMGATPGSVIICPYTKYPFVVPPWYLDGYASSNTTIVAEPRYSGK